MTDKVLIVDNDPSTYRLLEKVMHSGGLETTMTDSEQAALHLLKDHAYDIILMDVMPGDMEGLEVIRVLRSQGIKTPIMIVSEHNEDYDSLHSLSIGVGDYVTKPLHPLMLGAKVKALIRRSKNPSSDSLNQLKCGPFSCNTSTMRFYKDGGEVFLPSKEGSLMFLFMKHPGQIFTKGMVYKHVWDNTIAVDDNAIMACISRLRSRIEEDRQKPAHIMTVRSLGYRFVS